jgi:hypothetical protein
VGQLITLLSAIISLYLIIKKFPSECKDIKNTSLVTVGIWIVTEVMLITNINQLEIFAELLIITALSLVLVIFLMIVRHFRPSIFRYPYGIVFTPLILPLSYGLVIDVDIIKHIILVAAQVVTICVAILFTAGYWNRLQSNKAAIAGLSFLSIGFIVYWVVNQDMMISAWLWQILTAAGIIAMIFTVIDIIQKGKTELNN